MIDLAAISPAAGAKYSPNLHRWLKKQRRLQCRTDAFVIDCEGADIRRIVIGYESANWPGTVNGARLNEIHWGGRVAENHYTGRFKPKPLPGFFAGYQRWGRCFIDPRHTWNFSDPRWLESADRRVCLWCGFEQRKVKTERVVVDERWVTA